MKTTCDLQTGVVSEVPLTEEEQQELLARQQAASNMPPKPAPTKEQLMAELAALTAKIQALE